MDQGGEGPSQFCFEIGKDRVGPNFVLKLLGHGTEVLGTLGLHDLTTLLEEVTVPAVHRPGPHATHTGHRVRDDTGVHVREGSHVFDLESLCRMWDLDGDRTGFFCGGIV